MKHKHHIIPRHMGGSDDPSNLIELTIEEHANAHLALYEQYNKTEDLLAYRMLSGQISKEEFIAEKSALGGKIQGQRNADSGHIQKIQKLSNVVAAGKKGGKTTMARGKGSFADPVERIKSATKGGKTQGARNAESGHLKRIAQLPNKRSKGKMWITNGISNMMIFPTDPMPAGYQKGKTQKK